ncbi:FecCD family ABC transporter permease [Bacillus testis]|uniref:FecCD family ABC transporter permease n=1 Tax=Bacillus testis TaxID=1622072 RepID=UPI00067F1A96|nr:iron ABC transporter permease [Bacillus testis]
MSTNKRLAAVSGIAALAVVASIIAGVFYGSVHVTVPDILKILLGKMTGHIWFDGEKNMEAIIWNIRFSRVVLAFLVGASLSLAGAAFQGLLRNPLADPYTIGVSSGASFGAVLVLFLQLPATFLGGYLQPAAAIICGLGTLLLVLFISHFSLGRLANETIILAGVILSSFMSAFISLLISLSPRDDMVNILNWTMGSVAMRGWSHVQMMAPFFVVGSVLILLHARELNVLALGEQSAQFSGMDVRKKKKVILIGASILTGGAVAVSGAIGFVGLVIPHIVRLLIGANHKYVLPFSLVIGGAYLVAADLLARMIIAPRELPIGVITALIGAPVFAFLLVRQRMKASTRI